MELQLNNDHASDKIMFWKRWEPEYIPLCAHNLRKVVDISTKVETIYIVTAPKAPARANGGAFRLYNDDRVIHVGEPLFWPLKDWLLKQYKSGDRYAWIEY